MSRQIGVQPLPVKRHASFFAHVCTGHREGRKVEVCGAKWDAGLF